MLRAQVLNMAHGGQFGIVKVKQCYRDLVWWSGIDHDTETGKGLYSLFDQRQSWTARITSIGASSLATSPLGTPAT